MLKAKFINIRLVTLVLSVFLFALCSCVAPTPTVTLTISQTQLVLTVGDGVTLTATASNGDTVEWKSANKNVATVSQGTVVGVGKGEVVITAYTASAMATCTVQVTEKQAGGDNSGSGSNNGETGDNSGSDGGNEETLTLVWSDEFDGNALDLTKWGYQTGTQDAYHGNIGGPNNWGNNELQYYTEDSVQVNNGSLIITAQKREYGGKDYTSARILTRDLAYFTYGYIEAKMKTPAINGMWPAFWMLPQPTSHSSTNNEYGGWATNGEIDIMEAKGRLGNVVDTTLHFGGGWPNNRYLGTSHTLTSSTEEWHVYAIDWTAEKITWYIDGKAVFTLTNDRWYSEASTAPSAPFDKPFYLLFDLAVGGNYDGGTRPPKDFTSAAMYVDYVRVYKHN